MDIEAFLPKASNTEILLKISEFATSGYPPSLYELWDSLLENDFHTFGRHAIPRIACRGLVKKDHAGLRLLTDVEVSRL